MATDTYQFWGIVQSAGEVEPANIDYSIFYTVDSVKENTEGLVGTPVILNHVRDVDGGVEEYELGEVKDYELLEDNLFVLNQIEEEKWDEFVESFEKQESGIISPSWNELVEEIDAGNLALSAGLKNAATVPTQVHQRTVATYEWKEVSVVPAPANPGSWAWGCDESCQTVFDQTMSEQEVQLEGDDPEGDNEEEVVQNEPEIPDVVQMGDDEFKLVPVEEVEQSECSCSTDELEQELEQAKEERNQYKELVQEFREKRRKEATERLNELNQELPDDKAYDEDELDQMCEDSEISHLEQQADLMERLIPETNQALSEGEEDLSGSSSSGSEDEVNQEAEAINQASRDLFGKDLDDVMNEIDQKYEE